jgi:formate dehydrogenase subunit gamma
MRADTEQPRLLRFVRVERIAHWTYAALFLIAFVTGLVTWIPVTRAWLGGVRDPFNHYHGAAGLLMLVIPAFMFILFDRRRLRQDLREIDVWDKDDRRWFWAALRGGTLRGREMPAQGRLNAGQKMNAILVAAMAIGFIVTGSMLLGSQTLPAWMVSRALWFHGTLSVLAVLLFAGHLAHVFLTEHGRDSLRAMSRGTLSERTARERYSKWWQEMTGRGVTGGE